MILILSVLSYVPTSHVEAAATKSETQGRSTRKQHTKAAHKSSRYREKGCQSIHYTLTQLAEAKGFEKMVL